MRRICVGVLFASWSLLTNSALAQELTARQQVILRTALATDGWLTESMHREFWSVVPATTRSDLRAVSAITLPITLTYSDALRFQKATWLSVKLSLAAKSVTKTIDYELIKSSIIKTPSTPQERAAAEKGTQSADALLSAAATGTSMNGPEGPFYVTEALADSTLAGLEGSFHRLRKLTVPTWTNEVKEHDYPREHLKILWDGPFAREVQTIVAAGQSIPLTLLTQRLSETEHVAIGFMRLSGRWSDPQGASVRTATATLAGMGIRDVRPAAIQWRGRVSAEGVGSTRTSTGQLHASVRVVEAGEYKGAWQFMAISGTSLPDAIVLRERIEQASSLDSSVQKVASDPPSSNESPEQVLVDCEFQPSSFRISDPEAKSLHDDGSFMTLTFVLQLGPPKLIDPPENDMFWGRPIIQITPQELKVEWWNTKFKPLARRPTITVRVNRFSGKATESFAMFETPNKGPLYAYWNRQGQCEIHKRKF